jgi:hypothetical protein
MANPWCRQTDGSKLWNTARWVANGAAQRTRIARNAIVLHVTFAGFCTQ